MTNTVNSTHERYHLSDDEVAQFDDQGFLILRNRVPADLLQRLQAAAQQWIQDGRQATDDDPNQSDYKFSNRLNGARTMYRVDYLHNKNQLASLELLGSPAILGIAESLAGPNFVPTYESLVFKDNGDGAVINWHQDAVHPRNYRIFNIDVYLDASRKGEGSLRVAPGSQRQTVDICQLEQEYGWDAPGVIQTELDPGDVLIHDVMLVHGSEAVTGNRLRRTLYYEFRPAEQIMAEGPWDADWVDQRLRLIPLGLKEYATQHPSGDVFAWDISEAFRPVTCDDGDVELRIAHTVHTPGSFCSAGSVPGS